MKFVLLSIISANVQYVGGKDGETETPLISLYRLRWIQTLSAMKGYFCKKGTQGKGVGYMYIHILNSQGDAKNKF